MYAAASEAQPESAEATPGLTLNYYVVDLDTGVIANSLGFERVYNKNKLKLYSFEYIEYIKVSGITYGETFNKSAAAFVTSEVLCSKTFASWHMWQLV
jgi:hypothetical protein